jgi:peptide deformylase
MKLVNPVIVKKSGSEAQEEGCLSVPDAQVRVKRAKAVTVEYLDENGQAKRVRATGLLARVLQHEIDHLNGRVIIDYLGPLKRLILRGRLTTRA